MSSILILFQMCLGILLNFSFTGQFSCFALKCKWINVTYFIFFTLLSISEVLRGLYLLSVVSPNSYSWVLLFRFVCSWHFFVCLFVFLFPFFSPWMSFSLIIIYSVLFSENQVNFNSFKEDLYFLLAVICFVGTTNSESLYIARNTHFFILWSFKWHKFGSLIFMWPSFIYNLLDFFFLNFLHHEWKLGKKFSMLITRLWSILFQVYSYIETRSLWDLIQCRHLLLDPTYWISQLILSSVCYSHCICQGWSPRFPKLGRNSWHKIQIWNPLHSRILLLCF